MVLNWRAAPFIRLLFPFIIGIWVAFYSNIHLPNWYVLLPFPLLLLLHQRKIPAHQRWYFGSMLFLVLTLMGWNLGGEQLRHFRPEGLLELKEEVGMFQGRILDISVRAEKLRLGLQLEEVAFEKGNQSLQEGRLLVYLPTTALPLRIGDRIQFQGRLQAIPPAKNPKAFDFALYMQQQGYYYQAFVKEGEWRYLPDAKAAFLRRRADQLRDYCLRILQQHLPTPDEYAIGAALITGERTALSPEVKAGYAGTGAMHVLAVSGLHVGLIYLGLQFLLGLISPRYHQWKWVKMGLLLVGIWSFAYFTGATPSVIRAASMFSFVTIGQTLKRYTNIYNTIAASAFCMLLFNPILLFNIGFQLSYLALLGIVYFQDIFYKSWYIAHPVGAYIWKLSTVALAAQVTTLPISLYYFHQFPVYFLLSGLVVVPAAVVILGTGLALFFLHSVPLLGFLLGKILYACIWGMNAVIFFLQQLPYSTIQGIWINEAMLFTLYSSVIAGGAYLFVRKKQLLRWMAYGLLLFSGQMSFKSWQNFQRREIVIYHSQGQTIIDCIAGTDCLRISSIPAEDSALDWAVGNYQAFAGVKEVTHISLSDTIEGNAWFYQNGFLQFHHLRLALLDTLAYPQAAFPISLDYALLHHNPRFSLEELPNIFEVDQLIWDASNPYWKCQEWAKVCADSKLDYVDVREDGALVIRL